MGKFAFDRNRASAPIDRMGPVTLAIALLVTLLPLGGCLTLLGGEQRVGDQAAREIEQQTGVVRSAELESYVRAIGERLAAKSGREGPWRFVILDDPIPNAFALPGGHVYVTRGLLALGNSEDELAGVIGHEIGHVIAGHGGKRVTLNAPFAILTGITSWATGIVSPRLGKAVSDGGTALSQGLVVAPFSRQQERDADRIWQELAAAAGWDPLGISDFLETLGRATTLMLGEERRPSWLDTHPATPQRVAQTTERAEKLERAPHRPIAPGRRGLLDRLDGLLVGPDVGHGVSVEGRFVRPDWRVSIALPEDWIVRGDANTAASQAPSGNALAILLMAAEGDDPHLAVRALEEEIGEAIDVEEISIGKRRALRATGSERARGGRIYYESTWVAIGGQILRLVAVCEDRQRETWRPTFDRIAQSLRAASSLELASIEDTRLRSTAAEAGEVAGQLAKRTASAWSPQVIEVANAVESGHRFEDGALVKIARKEAFTRRGQR
ncbi:MAG: M48 family metalloprotease [Deltaproteobacteria bacterium]|jgi:predicted Zn-dependent protease|nr:M48 family metalloprotease [Deltaproteobacteria bacterium]